MVKNKVVIILGASRYYSKCIELIRNEGYYVIALDKNPISVGFQFANEGIVCDISDKEAVLSIATKANASAIVPLNDIGVPVASFVSNRLGLIGIDENVAELVTNKEKMRSEWIRRGIPCPKVFIAVTYDDFVEGINYVGLPCIFKPAHGFGGASRGVIVVHDISELDDAIRFTQSFYDDKTTLVETFIDSIHEHSAEVLIVDGEPHVIAISDKVKTDLPYRVDKNVLYPSNINPSRLDQLKETIKQSVIALGINCGAAHVELATTKDGFILFELGARCGGGGTAEPIVSYVTGIPIFLELVRSLCGDQVGNLKAKFNRGCNYHFLLPKPGIIASISGTEILKNLDYVLDFEFFKVPGEEIKQVTVGVERSGFIITKGIDQLSAYAAGIQAENLLKIEYLTHEN